MTTPTPDVNALIERLEALDAAATDEPWHVCRHLQSIEADKACSCGYRGVIYGPEHDGFAVCQPGHDRPAREEEWGSEPPSYPREQQIADMQLIAETRNALPVLFAHLRALQARVGELEAGLQQLANASQAYHDEASGYFSDSEYDRNGVLAQADAFLTVNALPKARTLTSQEAQRHGE